MNYYERHLGDYAKDTAHLTMLEHGAYGLLLDRYYGTEAGIPDDQAHRVARARTDSEKTAVDVVLDEFFTLVDGVWHHSRCDEEIQKAQTKIKAAKENGLRGGRPKRNPNKTQEKPTGFSLGSENETQEKPTGFSLGSENETQSKAHQTPDTRHQTPIKEPDGSLPPYPPGLDVAAWQRWTEYRAQIKKPLKAASIEAAQRALIKHGDGQADAVEQSIANGWQGLFEVKHSGKSPGQQSNKQEALEARNRAVVEAALASSGVSA
jgi:uncharacterized protein YdaU (DUF1376 family)